jgi:hypothetical protein
MRRLHTFWVSQYQRTIAVSQFCVRLPTRFPNNERVGEYQLLISLQQLPLCILLLSFNISTQSAVIQSSKCLVLT